MWQGRRLAACRLAAFPLAIERCRNDPEIAASVHPGRSACSEHAAREAAGARRSQAFLVGRGCRNGYRRKRKVAAENPRMMTAQESRARQLIVESDAARRCRVSSFMSAPLPSTRSGQSSD